MAGFFHRSLFSLCMILVGFWGWLAINYSYYQQRDSTSHGIMDGIYKTVTNKANPYASPSSPSSSATGSVSVSGLSDSPLDSWWVIWSCIVMPIFPLIPINAGENIYLVYALQQSFESLFIFSVLGGFLLGTMGLICLSSKVRSLFLVNPGSTLPAPSFYYRVLFQVRRLIPNVIYVRLFLYG